MHEGGHSRCFWVSPAPRAARPATVGPVGSATPRPQQVGSPPRHSGAPRPGGLDAGQARVGRRQRPGQGRHGYRAPSHRPQPFQEPTRSPSRSPPASNPEKGGGGAGAPGLRLRGWPSRARYQPGARRLRLRGRLGRARAKGRRAESAPQRLVRTSPEAGPTCGDCACAVVPVREQGRACVVGPARPRDGDCACVVGPGSPRQPRMGLWCRPPARPRPRPRPAPRGALGGAQRPAASRAAGGGGGGGRGRRGQTKPWLMNGSVRPRRPSSAGGREPRRPEPRARGECAAGGRGGLCLGRELAPRARPSWRAVGGRGRGRRSRGAGRGGVGVGPRGREGGVGWPGSPRHCVRRAGGGFRGAGAASGGLDPTRTARLGRGARSAWAGPLPGDPRPVPPRPGPPADSWRAAGPGRSRPRSVFRTAAFC